MFTATPELAHAFSTLIAGTGVRPIQSAKRAAVGDLMEGAHPVSLGFVQVLIDRGRLSEIDDGLLKQMQAVLIKPFIPAKAAKTIRSVLDAARL